MNRKNPNDAVGLDCYNQMLTGTVSKNMTAIKSDSDHVPCVVEKICGKVSGTLYAAYGTKWNGNSGAYSGDNFVVERETIVIENHPADSRVRIDDSGTIQTLTSRMWTGGGNVPMIMQPAYGFCPEQSAKTRGDGSAPEQSPTLRAGVVPGCAYAVINAGSRPDFSVGVSREVSYTVTSSPKSDKTQAVAYQRAETVAIEGNGQRESHRGNGWKQTDKMYTLNTTEVHAVAYSFEPGIMAREGDLLYKDISGTLRAEPGDNRMSVAYGLDPKILVIDSIAGNAESVSDVDLCGCLKATHYKNPPCIVKKGENA